MASPYARETSIRYQTQNRGLVVINGNTPEAHFLRRVHRRLIDEHFGGTVTETQRGVINLIAWAELRLVRLNAKFIRGEETPYDIDMYFAHSNALKRYYESLGLGRPKPGFAALMLKDAKK